MKPPETIGATESNGSNLAVDFNPTEPTVIDSHKITSAQSPPALPQIAEENQRRSLSVPTIVFRLLAGAAFGIPAAFGAFLLLPERLQRILEVRLGAWPGYLWIGTVISMPIAARISARSKVDSGNTSKIQINFRTVVFFILLAAIIPIAFVNRMRNAPEGVMEGSAICLVILPFWSAFAVRKYPYLSVIGVLAALGVLIFLTLPVPHGPIYSR